MNICLKIKQWLETRWETPCLICQWPTINLVCETCERCLPHFTSGCNRCGFPHLYPTSPYYCKTCFLTLPAYDRIESLFHYIWPVHLWVWQMKFQKKLDIAHYFGKMMAAKFNVLIQPDMILPVPLHPQRHKQRGYNQSYEIAKPIAKALNTPIVLDVVQRVKATQMQRTLPVEARWHNIKSAFEVTQSLKNQSILIVEDVVTTTATVAALSEALKAAGASYVQVWCACRSC